MRVHFDLDADAIYIRFGDAPIVESEEVHRGVVLDFNSDNRVVGIEVLRVTDRVSMENPRRIRFDAV